MEALIAKVNALLTKLYPSVLDGIVPVDKFMHFVGGLLIALVTTPFIGATSIVVVMVLAALKELYDWVNKDIHTPDFMDWVATVVGGVVGFWLIGL